MLWGLLGDLGSGKTLFMVLTAFSSNREMLTNFTLNLPEYCPETQKIDPIELNYLGYNKLVLLDELQQWINSRVSPSFRNRYFANIVNLSGHRRIDIYGSWHHPDEVDKIFRDSINRLVYCSRVGKEPKDNFFRDEDYRDFKFEIINTFTGRIKTKKLKYDIAKEYFPFYDTFEMLELPDREILEYELMRKDPQKYNKKVSKRVKNIALTIKPIIKKITHSSVELAMLEKGFNREYQRLVYAYLTGNVLENQESD